MAKHKISELRSVEQERKKRKINGEVTIRNGQVIAPDMAGFTPTKREHAREIAKRADDRGNGGGNPGGGRIR